MIGKRPASWQLIALLGYCSLQHTETRRANHTIDFLLWLTGQEDATCRL